MIIRLFLLLSISSNLMANSIEMKLKNLTNTVTMLQTKLESLSLNTVPVGSIQAYAGSHIPQGWMLCDGSTLEQKSFASLYAAIGDTWNNFDHPADGKPTVENGKFSIPNLNGLYLSGTGSSISQEEASRFGVNSKVLGQYASDSTATNGIGLGVWKRNVGKYSAPASISDKGNGHTPYEGGGNIGVLGQLQPGRPYGSQVDTYLGVISNDPETRPRTAPVTYIIKVK